MEQISENRNENHLDDEALVRVAGGDYTYIKLMTAAVRLGPAFIEVVNKYAANKPLSDKEESMLRLVVSAIHL